MTERRPLTDGQRHAIRRNRYDDQDFSGVAGQLEPLRQAARALEDVSWTGKRLVEDLFAGLHRPVPKLNEELAPVYRVNGQVMAELLAEDRMKELRTHTVGDPLTSGMAAVTMAPHVAEMLSRLTDVQEIADDAQEAQDDLDEFIEGCGGLQGLPGDGPGNGSGDGGGTAGDLPADVQAQLDELRRLAEEKSAELDEALEGATPSIGRAVRRATKEAGEEAEENAAAGAGWGWDPGTVSEIDPAERLALMAELKTDRMRKIADLFGTLRNEWWAERRGRFDRGAEEIYSVTRGDNLPRVLPSEFALAAHPQLRGEFFRRYAERELAEYDLRTELKEAKGAIIYVEDSSTSMRGLPERWARAVGLSFLGIAHDQGRAFTAIVFGGPGVYETFSFPSPADFTPAKMMAYARCSIMGGTDFAGPLGAARDLLSAEFDETGRVTGDIVFATDGKAKVTAEWLTKFGEDRGRLKFNTYGICIGGSIDETQSDICAGRVAEVHDLAGGGDIHTIFQGLAETTTGRH